MFGNYKIKVNNNSQIDKKANVTFGNISISNIKITPCDEIFADKNIPSSESSSSSESLSSSESSSSSSKSVSSSESTSSSENQSDAVIPLIPAYSVVNKPTNINNTYKGTIFSGNLADIFKQAEEMYNSNPKYKK